MHSSFWPLVSAGLALVLASWAGWLDWSSRRIPNWLTVPALLLGLAAGGLAGGWPGARTALEGAGVGLGLLLPLVIVRGLGAGDWKLMGALGAFLGPYNAARVLLATVVIAGLMAVVEIVLGRRVKETMKNLWTLMLIGMTFGHRGAREARGALTLDNPGLMSVPFGVAAALATVLFFAVFAGLSVFRAF